MDPCSQPIWSLQMVKATSIINFRTNEQGYEYINPCTMDDLKNSITKTAWKMFNEVECIRFPRYDNSNEVFLPYLLQGVVVLINSKDGVVIDKYGRYYGFSEWSAIKEICKKYFKRGKSVSDFKILFMTEEEYKTAKVKCINDIPHHYFDV